MAAGSGDNHHFAQKQKKNQEAYLALISNGVGVSDAAKAAGVKLQTVYTWRARDKAFSDRERDARSVYEKARERGAHSTSTIEFEDFSEEFLNMKVYPHQRNWVDILEGKQPSWLHPNMVFQQASPNRLLVNVPPEHAKSTTITINYCVYRICKDPNTRIMIVSKTQNSAAKFLYSIKQRLAHPRWAKLQATFGPAGGWKQDADQWKANSIYLGTEARDSDQKDPTVEAIGIGGQIYGARADLIILDDVVVTSNAHEWAKQLDWLQKEVITRLGKNGKLLIVGTRISSNDLYREIRQPEHWQGGQSPFTYLAMPAVLEITDKPQDWVTLWPKSDRPWDGEPDTEPDENGDYPKWDGPTLFQRRSEVTPNTWAMVYQQQDVESDAIFPLVSVNASINRMRKAGPLKQEGQFYTIMGLDPAMAGKTAAIMYSIDRMTGKRYVLDAYNMKDPTPGKIRDLISRWIDMYQPAEVRIETNAHQKAYALDEDFRQFLAVKGVKFSGQFTGNNKWDTGFGVAAMSDLFGTVNNGKHQKNNLIELPAADNEHFKALVNQLITWSPDTKGPTDLVMALWFCEIRAKEIMKKNQQRSYHTGDRWSTRQAYESQSIVNLDEMKYQPNVIYM
jgi:hypothetical protein